MYVPGSEKIWYDLIFQVEDESGQLEMLEEGDDGDEEDQMDFVEMEDLDEQVNPMLLPDLWILHFWEIIFVYMH